MKKRINKILWYGSELENGKAKVPSVSVEENGLDGLNEGELYISNNEIDPALFIRTSNSKVVRLGEANYKPFKFEYDESIDALVLSRTDGKPAHFLATGALSTRALGNIEEEGTGGGMDHVYNVDDFLKALDSFNKVSETDTFNAYAIRFLYEMVKKIEKSSTDTSYVDGKIEDVNKTIDTNTAYLSEWIRRTEETLQGNIDAVESALQENIDTVAGDLSTLQNTVNDFLTGTDTDTIINRWKELESFLTGYTETATLADLLSGKADKATTLAGYGITNAYTKTEVDNKITSVNTSVTTLQTTVSGHTTSINSLQNTVSGHTSSITSINSKITTLQGYFTNGVANFASRLSDGAEYKAWGRVFFKDGKPVNVSGEGTFTQVNADSVLLKGKKGKARLSYDSNLNALLLTRDDGTAVHFLASGAVATRGLGEIEEGGGGTGTGVDLLNVPSDIIPSVGGSYSLGTSGKPWKDLFVGDIQSKNIMPSSHYTYSLGADENRWSKIYGVDIYATRFTMNGEPVATRNWVNSQDFAKTSDLTSINNNISSLQASTFTGANAPEGKGYTLTWFTQSGGGRNVTIPAYGEITDGLAGIGKNVALVDQWLIADLISYVDGRIDLTSVASDIIPDGNLTRKLGSSSNRWSLLYVNSINAGTIAPRTDNGWDLGMTTFRWRNLYAVDGHLDSLTIGGETAATQSYVTSQLGSYATTSALSNYVTLNSAQTISGMKTFTGGITANTLASATNNAVKIDLKYEDVEITAGGWIALLGDTFFGDVNNDHYVYYNGVARLKFLTLTDGLITPSINGVGIAGVTTDGISILTIDGEIHSDYTCYFDEIEVATGIGHDKWYIDSEGDMTIQLINGYKPLTLGNTSFSSALSSGTVIGTITIGGESKTIYAPNGGSADLSNYVTLDSEQTITGAKTFNNLNANSIFSGQITSTVADGTAPFVVASKTLVSNLNADMLDGKHLSEILASDITGNAATATYATSAGNADTLDGLHADSFDKVYTSSFTVAESGWYRLVNVPTHSGDLDWKDKYIVVNTVRSAGTSCSTSFKILYSTQQGWNVPYNNEFIVIPLTRTNAKSVGNVRLLSATGGNARYIDVYIALPSGTTEISVAIRSNISGAHLASEATLSFDDVSSFTVIERNADPTTTGTGRTIGGLIAEKADKLSIARTFWGQSFDGSGNVSGNLTGVGTNITGSSQLIISSTNGDIAFRYNSDESKSVVLNATQFKPYNSANLKLDLGSSTARWKGIYGQSLGLSGGATIGGSLSLANNAPEILFYRDGESSWKILNYSNGNFYIQNNYTTEVQSSYFTVLQLNRNTGNATLKGSLTTGGNILPSETKTLNLGQADKRWNVYAASLSAINVTSSLTPDAVDSRDLGSTALPWYCGYIDYLSPKEIWFNDDEAYKMYVENSSLVVTSKLAAPSIMTDELSSSTSQYISVNALSLDLYECELYGYNSDNLDVWSVDFAGNAYFQSVTQTSDIRYKNIKEYIHLELSDIAAAPTFKFAWANETDGSTHLGTSAQYWQEIASELVTENKKTGKLGLDYSTAALVSAISIAREVNTMKMWQTSTTDRIEELEDKVKKLEEENKALRELLNSK